MPPLMRTYRQLQLLMLTVAAALAALTLFLRTMNSHSCSRCELTRDTLGMIPPSEGLHHLDVASEDPSEGQKTKKSIVPLFPTQVSYF